jgi:metalloendopeptidase OMA1, mitochondrial
MSKSLPTDGGRRRVGLFLWVWLCVGLVATGCGGPSEGGQGSGPGGRRQVLGLTPDQEYQLGEKAYQEILAKSNVEPKDSPDVIRVTRVGRRIVQASEIKPLQHEIQLHLQGYKFAWAFNVLGDRRINAFCLPGGKVAVFSGLLPVAQNDDQLATVMSHEIAHALAHHASERVARVAKEEDVRRAMQGTVGPELAGILAAGARLHGLKYDRQEEAEADHIGLFLMTFAGYDPDQAVVFWLRMEHATGGRGPPEILSDHPSDQARINMMKKWVPMAKGAYRAYKEGRIAPGANQ